MPGTALRHFNEDVARARAIITHADPLPTATDEQALLRSDLLRSGWMFAVAALDAYFSDAYTDVVAATIICKARQPTVSLPDFFYEIRFPVRAILEPYSNNENWRWRMAARKMMEREHVLKLETIRSHFNPFFRKEHRFFHGILSIWIVHAEAKKRVFGITRTAFGSIIGGDDRKTAINNAWDHMQERYADIFQRRHDCIHNCDRPKTSPQLLDRMGTVLKVIEDVEFLVNRCDEQITAEFREFLARIGCSGATINSVGYGS
jgi:hypothetical protein